ncbi:KEOPS complex subunit Pcc1 [Halomarina rubra]|uniref:KEOPS complex subunit Pcc1 n=1 Tax=Halomarina rubra TaxID=2071873 RepID=A0ABD6AQX3_9EURY
MSDPTDAHTGDADRSATETPRTATVRVAFDDAETSEQVAAALAPDNTPEMETRVEGSTVETTITRETTGGLRTTADDYVSNLQVAQQLTDTTQP